jgi:single-strand DNA-binding protein
MTMLTVTGNLAGDPEMRYTQQGKAVTTITVMTSRRTKQGEQWVDVDTTPWKVTAWERLAENVAETLHKGDPVVVVGTAAENSWEKDGQTYRRIEVTAKHVGLDLTRRRAVVMQDDKGGAPAGAAPRAPLPPLPDYDVPF